MKHRAAALAGLLMILIGASAMAGAAAAHSGPRTVHITIHYSHYDPGSLVVRGGETVRFVIENTDPIDHEFILGDDEVQRVHEEGTEAHHPPRPGEVSIPPHETVVTTYTFPATTGALIFGCHLPGHYAYGMHGTVLIA